VLGGIAHDTKGADLLNGEWGGDLDRTMLIKTAREVARQLVQGLPPIGNPAEPGPAMPPHAQPQPVRPQPAPRAPGPPPARNHRPRACNHPPRARIQAGHRAARNLRWPPPDRPRPPRCPP
jgi:hypothetical protein